MNEKVVQVSCQPPFLKRLDYCKQHNVASDSLSVSCWDSVEVSWDCHSGAKVWRTVRTLEGETVVTMSSYGLVSGVQKDISCWDESPCIAPGNPMPSAVVRQMKWLLSITLVQMSLCSLSGGLSRGSLLQVFFFYDWWIWVEQPPWLIIQNTT